MKKIDEYLPKKNTEIDYDNIIDRFADDPIIGKFFVDNDLTQDTIRRGINNLLTFKDGKAICSVCKGLYECKMNTEGYTPKLSMYNGEINIEYHKCRYNKTDDSSKNITSMYIPRKIFSANLEDFDMIGQERKEIHRYILKFLKEYNRKNPMKGIYLSGVFGSGKTYILATFANEIAKLGYKIVFVYYPDLVREIKSSIGKGNLEEKIEELKKVDMLFLDDIGGESPSPFIRDEVLGPILQHRVLDELPTFFSSNLKMKTLSEAMCKDNTQAEKTKSFRIYGRISQLADEYQLSEKPHLS